MSPLRHILPSLTLLISILVGAAASATSPDLTIASGEVGHARCVDAGARAFASQVDAAEIAVTCVGKASTPTPEPTATRTPSPTATEIPTSTPTMTATATAIPTATSTPTAQPAPSSPVANLAWFWRPGPDGLAQVQVIASRSAIVALQKEDVAFLKALRTAGYQGDILQYFLLLEVRSTSPAWGNNWAWGTGDYARLTDDMFLRRADGSRLCGSSNGMCYLDPSSAAARAFIVSRVVASKTHGFDGIILDNLRLRWNLLRERAGGMFYTGQRQPYASEADFLKAELELVRLIREANGDRPLWANMIDDGRTGSSWNAFLPYLDGGMDEAFGTGWPLHNAPLTTREYSAALTQAETVLAQGKGFIAVGQGKSDDLQAQEFFTASWLLVTNSSDRASLRYSQADAGYGRWWHYPSYDVACGKPLGPRYVVAGGFARKFEVCFVSVDPAARRGTIEVLTP